jgi:hypothetical protein
LPLFPANFLRDSPMLHRNTNNIARIVRFDFVRGLEPGHRKGHHLCCARQRSRRRRGSQGRSQGVQDHIPGVKCAGDSAKRTAREQTREGREGVKTVIRTCPPIDRSAFALIARQIRTAASSLAAEMPTSASIQLKSSSADVPTGLFIELTSLQATARSIQKKQREREREQQR